MATKTFNGWFYYAKLTKPVLTKEGKEDKNLPMKDKEYVVDVLITADTYKELVKEHKAKKIKALINCGTNEITGSEGMSAAKEFTKKYKVEPPFEADSYFVIKLRKPASFKDGNPSGEVRLLDKYGDAWNMNKLIGNGSKGAVQVNIKESTSKDFPGWSMPLVTVVIKDHVKFENDVEPIDYEFEAKPDSEEGDSEDSFEFEEKPSGSSKGDDWED